MNTGRRFTSTGLVFEFVVEPMDAVVAALHDDFMPFGGHHGEQAVAVNRPKRPESIRQPQAMGCSKLLACAKNGRNLEKGNGNQKHTAKRNRESPEPAAGILS